MKVNYKELKQKHGETLLLFNNDDYFVCYKEDAKTVANTCDLPLVEFVDEACFCAFRKEYLDSILMQLLAAKFRVVLI